MLQFAQTELDLHVLSWQKCIEIANYSLWCYQNGIIGWIKRYNEKINNFWRKSCQLLGQLLQLLN